MLTESPSSSPPARCPNCGAALPDQAPQGLCPKCLFAGLAAPTDDATGGVAPIPSPKPEEVAPHFPQLEILECLGRGGMGVVYKARQKSLDRVVALKLLAPERVSDPAFAERFAREAQALAKLNHPNIVTIHDFGEAGGFFYLLMEYVDGVNLRQAMKAGRFTPEQALAIVPPICDALQFAHEHGIVHRDIKPENLLLDRAGRVMIADFGIAKMLGTEGSTGLAESQPAGTPQYMAPEQRAAPGSVDHRADIYSLGVVFYEMLTGELPARQLEAPSSRMRGVHVDVRIDEIVLRALEKAPELRYQTAGELRTQVETMVQGPEMGDQKSADGGTDARLSRLALAGASPKPGSTPVVRRINRVALASALICLVLVFLGATLWNHRPKPVVDRVAMLQRFRQEISKQLDARGVRFAGMEVYMARELNSAAVSMTGLQERERIGGKNVWVDIEGSLGVGYLGDGQWSIEGFDRLGAVRFTIDMKDLLQPPLAGRSQAGFEPVQDRELSANSTLTNAFLDLDTGIVSSAPKELVDTLRAKGWLNNGAPQAATIRDWMQSTGADVIAVTSGAGEPSELRQLDGVGGIALGEKAFPEVGFTFDTVTAEDLSQRMSSFEDRSGQSRGSERLWQHHPSVISAFTTREGRRGLLEILSAKPGRVKLRYKLLAPSAPVPPGPASAAKQAAPEMARHQNLPPGAKQTNGIAVTATGSLEATTNEAVTKWICRGVVAEGDITSVEVGQEVRLTLDAFPRRSFQGRVAEVSKTPVTTQNVVTYETRIDLVDPDPKFKAGMTANLEFLLVALPSATPVSPQFVRRFDAGMRVGALASSADGKFVAVANAGPTLILMGDGRSKAVDGWKASVAILDATTGQTIAALELLSEEEEAALARTQRAPIMEVKSLAFSPDSMTLAVGTSIGQVKLFEARTGNLVRSLDDASGKKGDAQAEPLARAIGRADALAFSPDGTLLAVGGGSFADVPLMGKDVTELGSRPTGPGRLKIWAVQTGLLQRNLVGHADQVHAVVFSPDGTLLASAGNWLGNGERGWGVKIWDPISGEKKRTINVQDNAGPRSVAFSPDSKLIAIGTQRFDKDKDKEASSGAVSLTRVSSGIMEWLQTVPGWANPVAFTRDGRSVIVLSGGYAFQFLDVKTGRCTNDIRPTSFPEPERWNDLTVLPQTDRLAIGGVDTEKRGFIEWWDWSGAPIATGRAADKKP